MGRCCWPTYAARTPLPPCRSRAGLGDRLDRCAPTGSRPPLNRGRAARSVGGHGEGAASGETAPRSDLRAGGAGWGRYLPARRCQRVAFSIFLCFFLRMRLRRFLISEPMTGRKGSGRLPGRPIRACGGAKGAAEAGGGVTLRIPIRGGAMAARGPLEASDRGSNPRPGALVALGPRGRGAAHAVEHSYE